MAYHSLSPAFYFTIYALHMETRRNTGTSNLSFTIHLIMNINTIFCQKFKSIHITSMAWTWYLIIQDNIASKELGYQKYTFMILKQEIGQNFCQYTKLRTISQNLFQYWFPFVLKAGTNRFNLHQNSKAYLKKISVEGLRALSLIYNKLQPNFLMA